MERASEWPQPVTNNSRELPHISSVSSCHERHTRPAGKHTHIHPKNGPLRGRSVARRWLSAATRSLVQYVLAKGPAMISLSKVKRYSARRCAKPIRAACAWIRPLKHQRGGEARVGVAWNEGFRVQAVTAGSHHMFLGGLGGEGRDGDAHHDEWHLPPIAKDGGRHARNEDENNRWPTRPMMVVSRGERGNLGALSLIISSDSG